MCLPTCEVELCDQTAKVRVDLEGLRFCARDALCLGGQYPEHLCDEACTSVLSRTRLVHSVAAEIQLRNTRAFSRALLAPDMALLKHRGVQYRCDFHSRFLAHEI